MKLKHLRYFVAAAEEGSFHRASARLNVAQPALSRQIRDLESELGVSLFARSAQGVTLSPAGEVLFDEARRLLAQVELVTTRARRAALGEFGSLRVGFTMMAAEARFAMAAFADLRRCMPDLDCSLSLINSDEQMDALTEGEIDVGVLYRREPHSPDMVYRDLRIDRYMLLISSDHPLARKPSIRLAELQGEHMIFVSSTSRPATYGELMSACLGGGLTPSSVVRFEKFESEDVMINLAAEGIAVSLANSSLLDRRKLEGVTLLPVEDLDIALHFSVMWPRRRETPAILRFVDLLQEHLAKDAMIRST